MSDLFETVRVQSLAVAAHIIAALRALVESLEEVKAEQKARITTLEGQVEQAREALEDFANSGIRHDLHPTMHEGNTATGSQVGYSVGFVYGYLDRADKSIRERAKAALQALREGADHA